MRTNFECEIELQMSTILKFKYYGHHVMSRKFKYRYIEIICILPKLQISFEYHKLIGISNVWVH
jgi:hypothetical protein